jgi:hypothetical protein
VDYTNSTFRCAQLGLDLRDVNDTVREGYWVRLNNVTSSQEGFLTLRDGTVTFVETLGAATGPHSVRRLDPTTLIIGAGFSLFRNSTLYIDTATGVIFLGFSGNPLSMVSYKAPGSDDPWMFIGDSLVLKKVAADGRMYQWGGEPPSVTASAVTGGAGLLNSSVAGAVTYRWRYIYHSSTSGARTNPSPEMPTGLSAVSQQAVVTTQGSNDPQFDTIELFRTGGVNTDGTYRLVGTATNTPGPVVIIDNVPDSSAAVAEPMLTDRFRPFQSVLAGAQVTVPLPYIWPFQNFILGVGDTNRPGYLYWTNPGEPDSADVFNNVQITPQSEPLIAGFTYEKQPFTFSRDNLYAIEYGIGVTTFRGALTACGRGLSSPWAYSANGPLIYFLSGDGIYATDGQSPAQSITEKSLRPIFNGLAVGNFQPVDFTDEAALRLWWAGQELYFTYKDTAGEQHTLIWHSAYDRWRSLTSQVPMTLVYEDENQAQTRVFTSLGPGLATFDPSATTDAAQTFSANVRTGSLDFGKPQTLKEFGNIIIDADPAGRTIVVTPLYDAETVTGASFTLSGTGRQKFPVDLGDIYAYSVAFDFAWSGGEQKLYQFDLLLHLDEERIGHWEYPHTSHGLSGWQQLRDGYLALNSTGVVTMTVESDDKVDTYTIPSTAGQRRKLYVKFRPRKGKVFRYSLDGGPFLLYGDDCELRLKPWNTNLGYAMLSPFKGGGA